MKGKNISFALIAIIAIILVAWTMLTLYVERNGPANRWQVSKSDGKTALVVFDPDPFYNLDERVCLSFSKALAEKNFSVTVMTVSAAEETEQRKFDLFVFLCKHLQLAT
jgi:hypothetical protein